MPSIVSSDRSLFARSAPSATAKISPISIASSARWAAAGGPLLLRAARGASAGPARCHARNAGHAAHAIGLLLPLHLHRRGAEQRDLVAFLQPGNDFGEVVVADAEHHHPRLPLAGVTDEDEP